MATLTLKEFRCVEETDEIGSDSPHFLVFVGHRGSKPASQLHFIRDKSWDNDVDSGDFVPANKSVESGIDGNTLVLAALMEEDSKPDFDPFDRDHAFAKLGLALSQSFTVVGKVRFMMR